MFHIGWRWNFSDELSSTAGEPQVDDRQNYTAGWKFNWCEAQRLQVAALGSQLQNGDVVCMLIGVYVYIHTVYDTYM